MTSPAGLSVGPKFGLRRDNFILDPLKDYACFARDDIKMPPTAIAESLDIDLVTDLAPKRLVWGPYGGGKTHTLMRTMDELGRLTPIDPVRMDCPDLSKKSRFHDLYREGIMRAIGQDRTMRLIRTAVEGVGIAKRETMHAKLKERFGEEEVAKAAIRLIDPNFEELRLWRWISGAALSRAELDDLGQTQDLSETEAARLADIIALIGRLVREIDKKTLVLILDEMERLKGIGPETITTFVSGFTHLVDPNQRSVSVLIGVSAALESDMVDLFTAQGPVSSRLGRDARIEIPPLADPDVLQFITKVIAYVRDPSASVPELLAAAKGGTTERLTTDLFPFSEEAIDALKSRLQAVMTPREITILMTHALGRAHRRSQLSIASSCVV
jgi:hypothetical protein